MMAGFLGKNLRRIGREHHTCANHLSIAMRWDLVARAMTRKNVIRKGTPVMTTKTETVKQDAPGRQTDFIVLGMARVLYAPCLSRSGFYFIWYGLHSSAG
jgi:hypothetical protein